MAVALRKAFTLLLPLSFLVTLYFIERTQNTEVYQWSFRMAVVSMIVILLWGLSQRRQRTRGIPQPSRFPAEPLKMLSLLKSLEPFKPHCMWSGQMGQLWGVHVSGHQSELPFAQKGEEVWVMHLKGEPTEIDCGPKGIKTLEEGEFLKLPRGIGRGGLRANKAYLLWSASPKGT